ncbi:MAG: ATP-dependent zinc metalloprotease FtsH [Clostridiales bacterium]|nr:ATP-dependent zinc metalloprotease FtsH [Clostridiales bacterium]
MNENRPENGGNNNNNGGNNKKNGRNGQSVLWLVLLALIILLVVSSMTNRVSSLTNQEITYSEFLSMVEDGEVESVTITSSEIQITPVQDEDALYQVSYYTVNLGDENLYEFLNENDVEYTGKNSSTSSMIYSVLSLIIPLVIIWGIFAFAMRRMGGGSGGGIMGVGKSTAKMYVEKSTGVTFRDVAGQDEAKETLQEMVDFLNNPRKYTDIGAKLPKGALLVGPPGTGKTLLAKAVAGEAGVPFFSLAGSDFVEMFVGVGASRVRDLFKEAQKQAPCIIFIDEVDAIGKSRESRYGGGNDEREQTLNQLLAEMDGFDSSKGVLILAATNRPEVLDKALLRPGRFDRRVIVDKPDLKGRVETLKVHSRHVLMDDSVDLDALALATAGCVGSDLANMVNEAAINAVKHGRKYVTQSDLFEAVEVVIAGKEKKDRIMGPKEKRLVAYHEVGHALVSALQKDSEPVQKITIVPRTMGALGYTLQTPEEEKYLETKAELEARLVTYMGGRAAEEITCDSVTTGASNDIEMATRIARTMVTRLGMSDEFGLMALETVESEYLDGRPVATVAESTIAKVDDVVKAMLQKAYDTAKQMICANMDILERIADYLYEHETITGKEFMDIFTEMRESRDPSPLETYAAPQVAVSGEAFPDEAFEE